MKHILPALLITGFLYSIPAAAQDQLKHLEIGFHVGTLNYSGEIATSTAPNALLQEMRPRFGVHLKRYTRPWFNYNFEGSYGWISSSDANHLNISRGYVLTTHIVQTNVAMEFNFSKFGKYHRKNKFSIYFKLGGGMLFYNPKLENFESFPPQYELYPNAYVNYNIFAGPGIKIRTGYHSVLSIESTIHLTGTDHLEGFETPGASKSKDYYGGLTIGYSYAIF